MSLYYIMNNTHIFCDNIETLTLNNNNYRDVLFTSPSVKTQLVVMSLQPKQEIGMEKHDNADQFIRIEKGNGIAIIGNEYSPVKPTFTNQTTYKLVDGSVIIVPAKTWHNIINSSDTEQLKLYTLYSPPQHEDGLVQKDKPLQDGGSKLYEKYMKYKFKYSELKNHYKSR